MAAVQQVDHLQEPYVAPPSMLLALTEAHRVVVEVLSLGISRRALEKRAPQGDGHAVMVLPGFLGSDGYNAAIRRFLARLNYRVYGWGLGQNLGPRDGVLEALEARLEDLYQRHGSVSLIGHSLGGIFARELGREHPDKVRQVISLGSPFGEGRMTGSIPARLFVALNPPEELPVDQDVLSDAPPVPTTAIYSKGDGIVSWKTAYQKNGHEESQSIQVRGSHCGMTFNPSIWFLAAQLLAISEERWQPVEQDQLCNLVYPSGA
jgi:pimeloyl-ACP methyl ester carboxylesterase